MKLVEVAAVLSTVTNLAKAHPARSPSFAGAALLAGPIARGRLSPRPRAPLARSKFASGTSLAASIMKDADVEYTFHCYDHCPFGNRVAFLMDKFGIKYKKIVYGYGSGALPQDCEGEGYDGDRNPRDLTGKKQLPVLQGDGVPTLPGAAGMPESLEICSFLIGRHELAVPCATGRSDLDAFVGYLLDKNVMNPLTLVRLTKMPVADWADPRDVSYHLWKHEKKGDVLAFESKEEDGRAVAELNDKLKELPAMLRGEGCLNSWGWGMDDAILLPWLRRLTCIAGVEFPAEVRTYMTAVGAQVEDYAQHAV